MKCPHCGAEVTGNYCEYCGSQMIQPKEETKESDFAGGSKFTLPPDFQTKITFLIFGFVLCFPVPVTYLLWKSVKLSQKTKYILIGLLWTFYLGVFILPQIAFFIF